MNRTQHLAQTAVLLAVVIILGFIPAVPIGIVPVPIVVQNLGIMLLALILGPRWGSLATGTFLILIAVGLPILSCGRGGLAVLMGPTAGYLLAWALAPVLVSVSRLVLAKLPVWLQTFAALMVGVVASSYLLGTLVLIQFTHLPYWTTLLANWPFMIGDTIKAVLAASLYRVIRRFPLR